MTIDRPETSDSNLAGLLAELPDVVIVLDPQGRLLWGNHGAEWLFGRLLHELDGLPALELAHPDDLESPSCAPLVSVQDKEVGTLIEVRAKAITGWRLLEVLGAPVVWLRLPRGSLQPPGPDGKTTVRGRPQRGSTLSLACPQRRGHHAPHICGRTYRVRLGSLEPQARP